MTARRLDSWLLLGAPAAVLAVAFGSICWAHGTGQPWTLVVHEDGKRTLLGTIFYFEHACRELPLDLVLAGAVAGAVRAFFPAPAPRPELAVASWMLAGSVVAGVVIGTVSVGGAAALFDNLAQKPTRTGAGLVWGAHWRYHLLERAALMTLAVFVAGMRWLAMGRPLRGSSSSLTGSFVAFATLTLLFGLTTEPFVDARFLGHQARELLTHALVTLPLALGVVFRLAPTSSGGSEPASSALAWIGLSGAFAAAIGLWLAIGTVVTDAGGLAQTSELSAVVWAHFFEHAPGYVLVPSVAAAVYLSTTRGEREGAHV